MTRSARAILLLSLSCIVPACASHTDSPEATVPDGGTKAAAQNMVCPYYENPTQRCILNYNSALVASGEDSCCYHEGGINHCDAERTCNALSGASCCVLYDASGACCQREGEAPSPSCAATLVEHRCDGMASAQTARGCPERTSPRPADGTACQGDMHCYFLSSGGVSLDGGPSPTCNAGSLCKAGKWTHWDGPCQQDEGPYPPSWVH